MTIYWRCGCGKVQLELSAEPWSVGNCHCHSCVASSRFLDEKYKDQENYASSIADGGSAGAFFMPNDVKVLTEELPPLGCLKVGKDGKAVRKYCKCCGTQFGVVMPQMWALNQNLLYSKKEGSEKYVPKMPVNNVMKKFAFSPEEVPEPAFSIAPIRLIISFVSVIINPFGARTEKDVMEKLEVDTSLVEEVPITWE